MSDPVTAITVRLPARADAPAQARRSLRDACFGLPAPVLFDAELLTSELVTNAIKHASGILTVAIECDRQHIAVAVADDSPQLPTVKNPDAHDIGGRGMRLVDRLAAAWGARPKEDGTGKVVWFRVSV